ncbi:MAG: tetratricopeptide repeat protein [Atopostipes suicloacalis]|nr:tetratricopeptide repeat protein [Atopostipes suicloacalis]MDN6731218.1 tetratricopeptide repeat protein [Atopostipes suicloacalis]
MSYSETVIDLIQSGELEEVDENIQLALMEDDEETIYLLGNSLYQLGFLEETRRVYHHLVDLNPEDDELKIYLAEIEIEEGNDLEALEILHEINESSPAYPQALMVEADYYMLNDLPEVSLQKLDEANSILPNEPVILFALAEVYYTLSDFQSAVSYYEGLAESGEEDFAGTSIQGRLGASYLMTGSYEEAIPSLKEALTMKDDAEVYFQLGFAYKAVGEIEKAIDAFEKGKTIDPSYIGLYLSLSDSYEELQNYKKALEILEEAILVNEMDTDLYIKAGEVATRAKYYDRAKKYYKKALDLEPDNDRVVIKYARFLKYMDEYEEIVELYSQSSASVQGDPDASWILATANNMIEDYDQARSFFKTAYNYFADDFVFLKEYAIFLREDGQREEMLEVLKRYLTLNPNPDNEVLSLLDDFNY